MRKAKFNFSPILVGSIIAIVIAVLLISFSQDILGDVADDQTANTYEYNATTKGQESLDNVSKKTPTLGTIVIAVVLIAVLIGGFSMFSRR